MKKLFTLFFALVAGVGAIFASVQIDGIWYSLYRLNSTGVYYATVTYRGNSYSAYDDEYIDVVTIPDHVIYDGHSYTVTGIGEYAFRNCAYLTQVILPSSLTGISRYAFRDCISLTSINFSSGLIGIGEYAFQGCSGLTSIEIPSNVKHVDRGAFYDCSNLQSVTLNSEDVINNNINDNNNVLYVSNVFDNHVNEFIVGDNVSYIKDYAFQGCGMTSVILSNSVTKIGAAPFANCSGLTSPIFNSHVFAYMPLSYAGAYTIPDDIESIGAFVFSNCEYLTSISFPNSIINIGEGAFYECNSLTSLIIPRNVQKIGSNAFTFCNSLNSIVWEARACQDISLSGVYDFVNGVFPTTINSFEFGDEVEYIPANLCYKLYNLSSIDIPQTVRAIGDSAFKDCSSLTSITIPHNVTSVGDYAFNGCTALTDVNWNAKSCADFAEYEKAPFFEIRKNITSFVFGDNVNDIPARLCAGMSNAGNIIIPQSVTHIGAGAFHSCTGLTSISIPMINRICEETFYQCTGLTSVNIPNSVTSIGDGAFYGCSGLTTITIPEGVSSIGNYAFVSCENLTSVTIPESVTSLGTAATFQNCPRIKDVHWNAINCEILYDSNANTWYPPFYDADSIENFIFGENVERIPEMLCAYAKLKSIVIPNKVLNIGMCAFQNSTLSNVILGTRVKEIGDYAFRGNSLDTITSYAKRVPSVGTQAFDGTNTSRCILYVLAEYKNAYETDNFWGDFIDIRPIGANPTQTEELVVTPSDNTAKVVWPAVSGAVVYELVIQDKYGNEVCTLIFNANGQLTSIAFRAPSMSNAPMQTQAAGFEFTVTGLEEGSSYDLIMTSKDNNGLTLDTQTISFTTTGGEQGLNDVHSTEKATKFLHNNQIFILRGDKVYNAQGALVK